MNKEKEKEILENLSLFVDRFKDTHDINCKDFKVSKNISSGNGFSLTNRGSVWNMKRAKVSVNLLEPTINSIVYKFTDSPFDFRTDANIDLPELKFQLSSALRECVIDGLSYILIYKEDDKIRFSRLNNFNVIYDDCDYPNGKDAKEVIYIDKRRVSKNESVKKTDISLKLEKVLNLKKQEIPVITYWHKDEKGVTTYKIENDKIVSSVTQSIKNIPIARIYAKEVFINYERNWRGLYYLVKDILQTIDFEMSLAQERIATAPNHIYWIAEESIGSDIEQYSRVNDIPTFHKTYKSVSPLSATPLPPPTKNDLATDLSDLMQAFGVHREIIMHILGTISGEEHGSETAEAVLLRRESKDTAVNDLLKNLLDSSHIIAEIIEQFTGTKVVVSSNIFDKAKMAQDLERIIALTNYVNNNPHAYSILPVLISKLDVDETSKEIILQLMSQEKEEGADVKNKIEMLELENKQLKANEQSQVVAAKIEQESRLATKQMDMAIKDAEIALEYAKLDVEANRIVKQESADHTRVEADIMQKNVKLAQEAEKIRNDFKAKAAKLQLEAEKALATQTPPTILIGA